MAKFTAKTFQLTIEQFKLETVLSEIEYIFGFQCAEKKLGFKIDLEPSIANIVYNSDVKRLKRVLINLLSNSLKFTEAGNITVIVDKCIIDRQTYLKFNVIDTGVGISKHDIPKLFSMFGMLEKHRMKLNKSGSGLGLSISKKIIQSLGAKSQSSRKKASAPNSSLQSKQSSMLQSFAKSQSNQE